ncbi:MAG: hypothetical protein HQK91_10455 [Nitrospirae bacterium]|nr:hypothetical protein [Nitrospirota bacterium]MBF0541855.1 hypothetical protein [Nitrospirota bacterium]
MLLKEIISALEAKTIVDFTTEPNKDYHWVCATDLMSDVLFYSTCQSLLLTGLAKTQTIRTATVADLSIIIFTRNNIPDDETIELARTKGISLFVTPFSTFTASGKLFTQGLQCCSDVNFTEED